MSERIVDVLEMIEVDVEHGRRMAAAANLADHFLEPAAEIDPVGQSANRIVQGEMQQLALAGGDLPRCAAHMAHHQSDQERQAGERKGDRQHAPAVEAARAARYPRQAHDRAALRVADRYALRVAGASVGSSASRNPRNCSWIRALCSSVPSRYLTERTIGAFSAP